MSPEANERTRELIKLAQDGDAQARDRLVRENLALVKYIVKRFLNRGYEFDDLYQWGCLGLVKAIERFDPEYDVRFSTYAVPVIMGEIRRFLRDDGPVHVSRTIRENAARIERYAAEYEQINDRRPELSEIAEALSIDRETAALAMGSMNRVRSLSEPVRGDSGLRLMDVIGHDVMQGVDRRLMLSGMLSSLPAKERTVIVRRYFMAHTQTRIAEDLGMTQVQVSRMESRVLKKLRQEAGGDAI